MLRTLVGIFLISLSDGVCQTQGSAGTVEIRVRALDYKTGRPLKGHHHRIAVWLSDSTGRIDPTKSQELIQRTDKNGRSIFLVKEASSPKIWVDTDTLPDWNCSATWELATREILEHGIVTQFTSDATSDTECKKKEPPPTASAVPGEVVIFVHQLGLFGRFHRLFY